MLNPLQHPPCDDLNKLARWKEITGCTEIRFFPGGVWTGVFRYGFTDAILLGHESDLIGYSNRWCYEHGLARPAWLAWGGNGEPLGWHRHPSSGRRRPGGDPAREYVEP